MHSFQVFAVVGVLLNFVVALNAQTNERREFSAKHGLHRVRIIFRVRPFQAAKHKILQFNDDKRQKYGTWIDGKYALGTDSSLPRREIASIELFFDGRRVAVAKELFVDCYEPNFDKSLFRLRLSDEGTSAMVFMVGSDAAGSYTIFWILRKDARHARFSNKESDFEYQNIIDWFNDQ